MKIKYYIPILAALSVIFFYASCSNIVLMRFDGTVGDFLVDKSFDTFLSSTQGTGESTKLMLNFQNAGGELVSFSLAPINKAGTTISTQFVATTYSIDGTTNTFEGNLELGGVFSKVNGTLGTLTITSFAASGSTVTLLQGSFRQDISAGGQINGTFAYQAAQPTQ